MLSRCKVAATLPFKGLRKAEPFYSKELGLKRTAGSIRDGYLEFAAGKGTVIHLFESGSTKSEDTAATFEVADLAKEMTLLRKKGVFTMGKMKGAWIKDPGGNIIGLHQVG